MISIKAILTLNATSMDLIPVYILCKLNNTSTFCYMQHAALLVLGVSSLNVLCLSWNMGMGYLAYALIRIKYTNMFSVNLQPGILLKIYWRFKIEPHCFNGCVYQRCPQILAAIFRNMGICDAFTVVAATENMSRFILLLLQSFVSLLTQLTHCRQVPLFGIKSLDWLTLYH